MRSALNLCQMGKVCVGEGFYKRRKALSDLCAREVKALECSGRKGKIEHGVMGGCWGAGQDEGNWAGQRFHGGKMG